MTDLIDLGGHSLGAAHALIAAGMLLEDGGPRPFSVITCGSPAPGCETLRNVLSKGLDYSDQRAYRNAGDPVPLVPTQPPYLHPTDLRLLGQPSPLDFTNHKIALYQARVPDQSNSHVSLR